MGLGLSIVKGIIEAHGGTISEMGDADSPGAHFIILLPIPNADGSPAAGPRIN
jgi:signal transduction histidine kinase